MFAQTFVAAGPQSMQSGSLDRPAYATSSHSALSSPPAPHSGKAGPSPSSTCWDDLASQTTKCVNNKPGEVTAHIHIFITKSIEIQLCLYPIYTSFEITHSFNNIRINSEIDPWERL